MKRFVLTLSVLLAAIFFTIPRTQACAGCANTTLTVYCDMCEESNCTPLSLSSKTYDNNGLYDSTKWCAAHPNIMNCAAPCGACWQIAFYAYCPSTHTTTTMYALFCCVGS